MTANDGATRAGDSFLRIDGLFKSFGGLHVISGLSFSLEEGEILGVIGPNGSGKTTLFNLVSGFLRPDKGTITFCGNDITNKKPSAICRAGVTRTFQLVKPFPELTALENIAAGRSYGRQPAISLREARAGAQEVLEFCGMAAKRNVVAGRLNLIDRKRLEIARALGTRPKLLLLDEVFAGLNPTEIEEALNLLLRIRDLGITLMIVEHLMKVILGVSNRVVVMSSGLKIFEGPPGAAIHDEHVIQAYLGEDFDA